MKYELIEDKGHLLSKINGLVYLLDTGAPTSFGDPGKIQINNEQIQIQNNYLGLTAPKLSEYIDFKVDGLLGGDIFNRVDALIDIKNRELLLSSQFIQMHGNMININFKLGVPLLSVKVGNTEMKMIFDTGAKISYLSNLPQKDAVIEEYMTDFYPGIGSFSTPIRRFDTRLGDIQSKTLKYGTLPETLSMLVAIVGANGIVGNEVFNSGVLCYSPRQNTMVIQ